MKIHHALKETSYLTDSDSIAGSRKKATIIFANDYMVKSTQTEVATPHKPNDFTSIIYIGRSCSHSPRPFGETNHAVGESTS